MAEELTIFDVIRIILFWVSPVIFFEGLLLLLLSVGDYKRLENILGKEMGGLRKRSIPKIETNIYTFHNWLLKRKIVVALICIICSLVFLLLLRK